MQSNETELDCAACQTWIRYTPLRVEFVSSVKGQDIVSYGEIATRLSHANRDISEHITDWHSIPPAMPKLTPVCAMHVSSVHATLHLSEFLSAFRYFTHQEDKAENAPSCVTLRQIDVDVNHKPFNMRADSIGFRMRSETSPFPALHSATCTQKIEMVLIKDRAVHGAVPMHVAAICVSDPSCAQLRTHHKQTDLWKAAIIADEVLLAQILWVVKKARFPLDCAVELRCIRSCICADTYADLLCIDIKHREEWVFMRTCLAMVAPSEL